MACILLIFDDFSSIYFHPFSWRYIILSNNLKQRLDSDLETIHSSGCLVHFMGKFYLLALSEEAESLGESAVAAAVHPVFVRGAWCC